MRPFCLLSVGLFVVPLVVAAPLPIGDKLPAVAAPVPAQGSPPPDANLVPVLAPIPEDVAAVSPGTAQEATSEISKETPAEAAGAYPPRVPETYTPEQQKRLAFTQRFQNQIIHGKILATRGPGNRMLVYTRLFLFKAEVSFLFV